MEPELRNGLRDFIKTESGKALLLELVNQEVNLLAKAYKDDATQEEQVKLINKVAGINWVRNQIDSLIQIPKR